MTDAPKRIFLLADFAASKHVAKERSRYLHGETEYHRSDLSADLVRAGYLAGIGAAQSEGFSAPVSPDYIAAIVARVTEEER